MNETLPQLSPQELVETVRQACLAAAITAYEQARTDGLCDEGALEFALDAIRRLDTSKILAAHVIQK
ncbi:MAG: acetyltransferase [Chloroflexi bacterium]|nr:acetyltransferase [Chloroflexota bacterium]